MPKISFDDSQVFPHVLEGARLTVVASLCRRTNWGACSLEAVMCEANGKTCELCLTEWTEAALFYLGIEPTELHPILAGAEVGERAAFLVARHCKDWLRGKFRVTYQ